MFGWDGDTLAYESAGQGCLYEVGSFVPMVQYVSAPVEGFETPSCSAADRYVPQGCSRSDASGGLDYAEVVVAFHVALVHHGEIGTL